jgi:hypothetical protein
MVSISIKSTYFHSISTGFNKRSNLFWEQMVGGSNPSAPTSIAFVSYSLSLDVKGLLIDSCSSLGILQLQNRLQIRVPELFIDCYAVEFSMVLKHCSKGNHLFQGQLHYRFHLCLAKIPSRCKAASFST